MAEWLAALDTVVQRLNGIIDQAEQNPSIRAEVFGSRDGSIADDEVWESVCEVLFSHPGVVLEFEYSSEYTVFSSKIGLGNRLVTAFIDIHPYIGQQLIMGPKIIEQVKTLLNNLSVELGDDEEEIELLGQGIQVLLLYILVQRFATPDRFFEGATPHPDVSQDNFSVLAEYVIEAEELLVSYGLMSSLMVSVTLKDELDDIKSLA